MTAYTEWLPGPTQAEQYNSFDNAYGAFIGVIQHERVGSIGGSGSYTWYITGGGRTEGPNPEMSISWASTADGHTATSRIRYNPTLLGTLDPSIPYAVDTSMPQGVLGSMTYAQAATWISRVGGITPWRGSVMTSLSTACIGMAASPVALTLTVASFTYTDGGRAGGTFGMRMIFQYNPSSAELTAGINQLESVRVGIFSDASDGTINVNGDGSSLGTAVVNVPVVQFQSAAAEAAWLEFTNAELDAADFAGFYGSNTVSNVDDLGQADPIATEPPAEDARSLFVEPDTANMLMVTPTAWPAIYNPAAGMLALILSAGAALATWATGAVTTKLASAAVSIYSVIEGAVVSGATAIGNLVTPANTIATNTAEITTALDFLASDNASNALTSALQDSATALESINNHQNAIEASEASQVINGAAAAGDLERIANSLDDLVLLLRGDPLADPAQVDVRASLQSMREDLQDVAEFRNHFKVKTHGSTFEGWQGVGTDEEIEG